MRHNERGFSLIELLIAVTILGILAAVAIPTYMGIQKRGKRTEYKSNLEIIKLLEEKNRAERGVYVAGTDTVDLKGKLADFRPGDPADLLYEYSVVTFNNDQEFTVVATGKPGTSDVGKKFCIDHNNVKDEGAGCP